MQKTFKKTALGLILCLVMLLCAGVALTAKRDDCTLAYSVLCTVNGEYARAQQLLLAHRFHTYEGGEGYLTQHHAWLHFLMGRRLLAQGKSAAAERILLDGLVFPENYGEEKNYFVNDAPIYSALAMCMEREGKKGEAERYWKLATSTKGAPTVHSYFQCIALHALGRAQEAQDLAREMVRLGEECIANAAVNDYYGMIGKVVLFGRLFLLQAGGAIDSAGSGCYNDEKHRKAEKDEYAHGSV